VLRLIASLTLALAAFSFPLSAQARERNVAERLGLPVDAKLLILHADDLGVAHSEDAASFAALDSGAVSSASIMMPTPWVSEVANYARAHPDADLGLHLTLTAEWRTYKWGSIAPADSVPSLLDSTGFLPASERTVAERATIPDVERELRAQVQRALTLGIHPTHLDSHMGSLFSKPELIAAYMTVAHEYHLPFLAVRGMPLPLPLAPGDFVVNSVIVADPVIPRDHWKEFYLNAIANLKPGLHEMIVHLGYDNSELRAVTVDHGEYGAAWRQRDYDVITSREFRQALKAHGVHLVTYRELQKAMATP
jgi:predicted glycoside hydrolase/deacetylase ChbG (UPF0249 family)